MLLGITFMSCTNPKHVEEDLSLQDLPEIRKNDTIRAATLYSSISYFQYKMQTMGYEYDLIRDFAESEKLHLEIKIAKNEAQLINMLEDGEVDVVAFPIPVNNELKEKVIYCGRESQDCQVLIQKADKGDTLLTDVTQLIGKDIYVNPNTKYDERLQNLNEELGGGIHIHHVAEDSVSVEDLISDVSASKIAYTVSEEKVGKLNKTYYWNLNVDMKISFMQRSSWIVRKNSPLLAKAIDEWSSDKKGIQAYRALMKRYFELSKQPFYTDLPEVKNGHVSIYDSFFHKYAKNIGWDWQLLASIAYQESRFDPSGVSWAGAEGLMGIMPNTAKALGVSPHELKNPEIGVRTGVDCLRRFRQGFNSIKDPKEKIKFTLAAYNSGIGHVYDAQRLAEKYGKNPNIWDNNVADYIKLKNDPEYYNDPVCKHGYLRGSETYNYVREVLERYKYYMNKTKKN